VFEHAYASSLIQLSRNWHRKCRGQNHPKA